MKVTFPEKQADVAELAIDGKQIRYRIPPVIGNHSECFSVSDSETRTATGTEIAAYVFAALVYKKNEWADQERIIFPTKGCLRVPPVLTTVPNRKEFGDLAGVMLVDLDLAGEGIEKRIEVPEDFIGWEQNVSGLMVRDNRIAIPNNKWNSNTWNAKNGVAIALFGEDGAEILEQSATDSGRNYNPLWRLDVNSLQNPTQSVPFVVGYNDDGLSLCCYHDGFNRDGCAVRVLK